MTRQALAQLAVLLTCAVAQHVHAQEAVPSSLKNYKVVWSQPKTLASGASETCAVSLFAVEPWTVKADTPFVAVIDADPGLTVEKTRLENKDFVDPKAKIKTVQTSCIATDPGTYSLRVNLVFFLCSSEMCLRVTDKLQTSVVVQ